MLGQTENAQPVTGTVFIRPPSGAFVKLTGAQQIPSGAQIDALHGSLQITTAPAQKGKTQQGVFGGAVFKLTQARAGATKGLATLTLLEGAFKGAPTYATCKKAKAGDASAAAASSKVLQLLHASAHGKFRPAGATAPPPSGARCGRSPTAATALSPTTSPTRSQSPTSSTTRRSSSTPARATSPRRATHAK